MNSSSGLCPPSPRLEILVGCCSCQHESARWLPGRASGSRNPGTCAGLHQLVERGFGRARAFEPAAICLSIAGGRRPAAALDPVNEPVSVAAQGSVDVVLGQDCVDALRFVLEPLDQPDGGRHRDRIDPVGIGNVGDVGGDPNLMDQQSEPGRNLLELAPGGGEVADVFGRLGVVGVVELDPEPLGIGIEAEQVRIQVAGLKDIAVPHSKLSGEPDLRAIAKIFETINRTGKRLDTFDLLVARLYPFDFRLRDKWDDAQAEHDEFQTFEIDGLEVLKLIALRQHISESAAGRSSDVKGVKQSDVLMLEPETVKREWDIALKAYVDGLGFLKDRCGVVSSHLLPQPSIPLTVGYFHASDCDLRRDFKGDLERWYWASCFKQTYAQGANTQVLQDVKALRAWNSDESSVPVVVSNFQIATEQLGEGRRLNEMLLRGILGRQISRGVKDWSTGKLVSESPTVEIHHVFPSDFLKTLRGEVTIPKDPILNFVAISGATNKKIRNESPAQVIRRADIRMPAVKTHGLEEPWLSPRGGEADAKMVARFLNSRLAVVKELIETAVMGD